MTCLDIGFMNNPKSTNMLVIAVIGIAIASLFQFTVEQLVHVIIKQLNICLIIKSYGLSLEGII
jgi:hypothetical protein